MKIVFLAFALPFSAAAQTLTSAKPSTVGMDSALVAQAVKRGGELSLLTSLLISRDNKLVTERYYRGMRSDRAVNIKSASKSIVSALVGIAVEQQKLRLDQPIADLLPEYFRRDVEPERRSITLRHLLSMTAGIESTSFDNYGSWTASSNWVRNALTRPLVCAPGTCMVYSTGNSHVLSAILTRKTGVSTRAFANRYLFAPMGTQIGPWTRDPQGVYLGGNEMQLTPRQLLRFGQLYLNDGKVGAKQVLPSSWIQQSWTDVATSPFNGYRYGLGWWSRDGRGYRVHFAWGYGGQYVFVVPDLRLVVVATSALSDRRDREHNQAIHRLLDDYVIPAAGARFSDARNP